ncbi:MAG: hypothetical protein OCD01_09875 [Fibrobacterales bacterium]
MIKACIILCFTFVVAWGENTPLVDNNQVISHNLISDSAKRDDRAKVVSIIDSLQNRTNTFHVSMFSKNMWKKAIKSSRERRKKIDATKESLIKILKLHSRKFNVQNRNEDCTNCVKLRYKWAIRTEEAHMILTHGMTEKDLAVYTYDPQYIGLTFAYDDSTKARDINQAEQVVSDFSSAIGGIVSIGNYVNPRLYSSSGWDSLMVKRSTSLVLDDYTTTHINVLDAKSQKVRVHTQGFNKFNNPEIVFDYPVRDTLLLKSFTRLVCYNFFDSKAISGDTVTISIDSVKNQRTRDYYLKLNNNLALNKVKFKAKLDPNPGFPGHTRIFLVPIPPKGHKGLYTMENALMDLFRIKK